MNRTLRYMLLVSMIFSLTNNVAYAAVISTEAALAGQQRADAIARINGIMGREDVRAALVSLGVDPDQARARVDALSPGELAALESRLNQLPAGGVGVIEVVGIVAVVLILLEVLGVTDVFTGF